jgi:4-diphosphocytidyl-2C-methyl-D-erythritol kinase
VYLLPEFKKTDYFLKLKTQRHDECHKIRAILNTIDSISAVYCRCKSNKIKKQFNLTQMISNKKPKL